jgi:hypothetical protein
MASHQTLVPLTQRINDCFPPGSRSSMSSSSGSRTSMAARLQRGTAALVVARSDAGLETRLLGVVFSVKVYVGAERRHAGASHYHKKIERKDKEHSARGENCRNEKVRCVVSLIATMSGGTPDGLWHSVHDGI